MRANTARRYSKKIVAISIAALGFLISTSNIVLAQSQSAGPSANSEQQVIKLSGDKWRWMADKNVDSLVLLFDEKAVFVHMGGSWGKQREVDIIKSGGIYYKKADVHKVSVNIIGSTAILLNRITLLAVVGGREVTNEFEVTEVYVQKEGAWKLGSLSFTKVGG